MRPKSVILLVLALGCGVVASMGIKQVMAKRGGESAAPEVEPILVAISDIPMGDPVSPQMVKLEEWPKDKVPKGALKSLEEIENRRPKSRVFAGSPILDNQLLGKGVLDQGASDAIPKGMRVIAVKVDLVSGSASLIRPGDRVDLLVHLRPGTGDLASSVTKTVLQDIKVFAVDNLWEAAGGAGEKSLVAKTVSLLVTPAQAEKVTLASEMGGMNGVRLVMRSPNDKEQVALSGAGAAVVLGSDGGGSDRSAGSLLPQPAAAQPKGSSASGLLGLLNRHKQQKTAPGEPAPSAADAKNTETFTIRILSGSQSTETVLEAAGEGRSLKASDASFLHWKPGPSASSASPPPAPIRSTGSPSQASPGDPDDDLDLPPKKPDKKKSLDN